MVDQRERNSVAGEERADRRQPPLISDFHCEPKPGGKRLQEWIETPHECLRPVESGES